MGIICCRLSFGQHRPAQQIILDFDTTKKTKFIKNITDVFYFQTRYSSKLNRNFWWLYPNLTSLVHQNKQVYFVKILKTQLHPSSGRLETAIEYDCKFCDLVTHGALRSSHELVEKCPCVPDRIGINLKVLVLKERGKTEYPKKKPLEARERTNHNFYPHMASTQGLEPLGHKGGRRVLSPLRHPCSYLQYKTENPLNNFIPRNELFARSFCALID